MYLNSDISDTYYFEVLFGPSVEYYSDYFKIDKGLDNIIIFWEHDKKVCSSANKISQNLILPSDSFISISAEITEDRTDRSEEHTSELQSRGHLVCRLLLEQKTHR